MYTCSQNLDRHSFEVLSWIWQLLNWMLFAAVNIAQLIKVAVFIVPSNSF